jgi:hypothetical protein
MICTICNINTDYNGLDIHSMYISLYEAYDHFYSDSMGKDLFKSIFENKDLRDRKIAIIQYHIPNLFKKIEKILILA